MIPQYVQDLCSSLNPIQPSVTLQWSPPGNCTRLGDVIRYHIRYKKKFDHVTDRYIVPSPVSDITWRKVLTCDGNGNSSSLKPLTSYVFEVRAEGQNHQFGEWSEVECFISM